MQFFSVLRIVGILITWFSVFMLLPAIVSLIYDDGGGSTFMQSFGIFFVIGGLLWWSNRQHNDQLRSRDGFLIVVIFWLILGILGAVPFLLSKHLNISLNSAIFESISGFTTTGATVLTNLEELPKSLLFYRQLTNWFGGMGIIVLMVAVLPLLGVGGNQLYNAESSGINGKNDKIRPRIAEVAKLIWLYYVTFTLACTIAYKIAGMDWFDAICHSFATLSNGGFSTYDSSLAHFNNSAIYIISSVFMFIGGMNYNLHITALTNFRQKGSMKLYWQDAEFRTFVYIQTAFMMIFSLGLYVSYKDMDLSDALVKGSLQMSSMAMNSGYTIFNIDDLPPFLSMLLVFACILGGCAGSSAGGLKMGRVLILWLLCKRELLTLVHPNVVNPVKMDGYLLPNRVVENVSAFLIIYILTFWICVFLAILCGMGGFDAIGAVIATITNTGPGLGITSQNFAQVPDNSKLVFSFAMVAGRLEFFSLIVIFMTSFWKK